MQKTKLPLTGARCVSRIITDIAVFDVDRTSAEGGLTLVELLNGSTVEEVKEKTDATFEIGAGVQ